MRVLLGRGAGVLGCVVMAAGLLAACSGRSETVGVANGRPGVPPPQPAPAPPPAGTRPRILLMGDSLLYQIAADLRSDLGPDDIEVANLAVPGTGLLVPDDIPFLKNWLRDAPDEVASLQPAAVVVEFVGNYGPPTPLVKDATGQEVQPFSDRYVALWRDASRRLAAELAATGVPIVWLIPPPVAPPLLPAMGPAVERLVSDYRALPTLYPGLTTLDMSAGMGLAGRDAAAIAADAAMRAPDRVHLSSQGSALAAASLTTCLRLVLKTGSCPAA